MFLDKYSRSKAEYNKLLSEKVDGLMRKALVAYLSRNEDEYIKKLVYQKKFHIIGGFFKPTISCLGDGMIRISFTNHGMDYKEYVSEFHVPVDVSNSIIETISKRYYDIFFEECSKHFSGLCVQRIDYERILVSEGFYVDN